MRMIAIWKFQTFSLQRPGNMGISRPFTAPYQNPESRRMKFFILRIPFYGRFKCTMSPFVNKSGTLNPSSGSR